jgi:DNA mismatch endonuclease (patch repair protein)
MTDKISKERRSANMRAVRNQDTGPEMRVRQVSHGLGYRFRLHRRDLPGKPDLAFPGRRKVIFVHGCFWHQHKGCRRASMPQSNVGFWRHKLERNAARDADHLTTLKAHGWKSLVIWECETKDNRWLAMRIRRFLGK